MRDDTDTEDSDSRQVLVISQFYPPEGIGGGYRWERLVNHLPDTDEFRVLCPPPTLPYGEFDRSYRPIRTEIRDGVPVTRLWTYQPQSDATAGESNLHRMLNYGIFAALATLYVIATFWRYDVVVTMSSPHTTFLPGIVGQRLGCAWVVDVYDRWLDNALDFGYTADESILYSTIGWLERRAMTSADAVITITPTLSKGFQEKYPAADPSRFTAVPFGVSPALFEPQPESARDRRIVYLGNLGEVHAFEPFMRAFAELPSTTTLQFIGDGKRRAWLEQLAVRLDIEEQVEFAGTLPREAVAAELSTATASIVPLSTENQLDYACPTKLIETMAVGTPFVGSALTEIERVAAESGGGFAVANEPAAIEDAFDKLLAHDDVRRRMGADAVAYIDRNHRWPRLAISVDETLTRVCA
jgi:glycosyltransferase involved in cell wall biosynthesis